MKKKLKLLAGAVLSAAVGSASAAIVSFEDDDIDFHLRPDANGVLAPIPAGQTTELISGDVLFAVLEYNSRNGVLFEPAQELTGIAVIQATADGMGGFNAAVNTFGTVDINVAGGGAGGGAVFALWLDNSPDLAVGQDLVITPGGFSCGTLSACVDQAIDGALFEVDGFEDGSNDYWNALTFTTDTNVVLNASEQSPQGFFSAGLSVLDPALSGAATNEQLVGDTGILGNGGLPVDMTLTGAIYGGGGDGTGIVDNWGNTAQRDSLIASGYVAVTDNQLQKFIPVPVPGPLALIGLGMLGLSLRKARRRT